MVFSHLVLTLIWILCSTSLLLSTKCVFILQYQANESITLMTHGGKPCGLGNFVKFEGGDAFHHNMRMLVDFYLS
jgi:hypothetical protein